MQPINGRQIARTIREEIKTEVAKLDFRPGLGVILVGDDPASHLYVSLKEKACRQVGLNFRKVLLPTTATESEVLAAVANLNADPAVHAFIIQLPLPEHLDEDRAIAAMLSSKDADGFHNDNLARLTAGRPRIYPVLPQAVMALLNSTGESLNGKKALVISNSPVFYTPLEVMLGQSGLQPKWLRADSTDLETEVRQADVLIVAAGRPGLIDGRWLKPGAVAVDIGTNRLPDGSLIGDIDASRIPDGQSGWITPVPGGVGPMTVAMLLRNAVELARQGRK